MGRSDSERSRKRNNHRRSPRSQYRKRARRSSRDSLSSDRRKSYDERHRNKRRYDESPGRGRSYESDFSRLADAIQGITKTGYSNNFINAKILPEFDPASNNISATESVEKVEGYAKVYKWTEDVKLFLGQVKLAGNAKVWHDQLHTQMNWSSFSRALIRQFPGDDNFGRLFAEASNFASKPEEDLQIYCFKKVGKINKLRLNLSEKQKVDLVLHGIHDKSIRTTIQAARCKTLSELNDRLNIFRTPSTSKLAISARESGRGRKEHMLIDITSDEWINAAQMQDA